MQGPRLPPGHGKLLFSKEEVAADISDFYKKYLRNPLKRDLGRGAVGREISKYFSIEEINRLPEIRILGQEKMDEAGHKIAGELLAWLEEIASNQIILDMELALEEHVKSPDHMKLRQGSSTGKEFWECRHKSKCVELSVYREKGDDDASVSLSPARGLNISNHLVEGGWNDIVFPLYYVKEWSS